MRFPFRGPATDSALEQEWRSAEYCVIDLETTGLDLRCDEIISVGAVPVREGRIDLGDSFYSLVRPRCAVSVASIKVHGLRPGDLDSAPDPATVGQALSPRLSGRVVVAHAAWIERAFLSRTRSTVGWSQVRAVVDTAALARATGCWAGHDSGREPPLELLARRLGLPVCTPHHALGDALTTATVFLALAARAERTRHPSALSVRDLCALSNAHAH
ncbi:MULTISPECIES: PolC-type DNA polymerase III [Streptomyces]|uniref:3'-5' exonuclease n=1 Tax=Streptomyces scabiei TaxID=1930 RepID=UPI00062920A6|nr:MULTISPECIES: 3'-5' exonuclease [Streptomyces]MDW8470296.1 3'-5' exonuclease [Streptomyces scabiei]MDX2566272.1 3'-5' exonuclease [Streptomyces scabiei]MDX2625249.1 3'-5' exonuclease [Streptomyces scabiei]MDX2835373.1 3'-5' exonuclease [Streptomyces scabiei]MDX3026980.1 3'-5' exonuclease [Streptomyces scabiei]